MITLLQEILQFIEGQHLLLKELNGVTDYVDKNYEIIHLKIAVHLARLQSSDSSVKTDLIRNAKSLSDSSGAEGTKNAKKPAPMKQQQGIKIQALNDDRKEDVERSTVLVKSNYQKTEEMEIDDEPQSNDLKNISSPSTENKIVFKKNESVENQLKPLNNKSAIVEVCVVSDQPDLENNMLIDEYPTTNENGSEVQDRQLKPIYKGRTFQCGICDKFFTTRTDLRAHCLKHAKDKPFQCEICLKNFSLMTHLQTHNRLHSDDRPFPCETCGIKFMTKSTLQRHQMTHTGERAFGCTVCERKFTRKSHLKEHSLIHSGEKPFQCPICFKKTTRKSNLKHHLATHKKEGKEIPLIINPLPLPGPEVTQQTQTEVMLASP